MTVSRWADGAGAVRIRGAEDGERVRHALGAGLERGRLAHGGRDLVEVEHLGFGRIVGSEIEVPHMLVNTV